MNFTHKSSKLAGMKIKRKHTESSSSSEEDPNLAEAVDPEFHQAIFSQKGGTTSFNTLNETCSAKASLRRDKLMQSQKDETGLNVTPEFKTFVAKKLSQVLDMTYETTPFKLIENNSNLTQSRLDPQDEGVKLFSTSRKFIKEASYDGVERKKIKKKNKDRQPP